MLRKQRLCRPKPRLCHVSTNMASRAPITNQGCSSRRGASLLSAKERTRKRIRLTYQVRCFRSRRAGGCLQPVPVQVRTRVCGGLTGGVAGVSSDCQWQMGGSMRGGVGISGVAKRGGWGGGRTVPVACRACGVVPRWKVGSMWRSEAWAVCSAHLMCEERL